MRLGWGFILTPEKPVEESVECSVSTSWVAGGSWLKDEAEEEHVRIKYVCSFLMGSNVDVWHKCGWLLFGGLLMTGFISVLERKSVAGHKEIL